MPSFCYFSNHFFAHTDNNPKGTKSDNSVKLVKET